MTSDANKPGKDAKLDMFGSTRILPQQTQILGRARHAYDYTSEVEIRERVLASVPPAKTSQASTSTSAMPPEERTQMIEAWIERLIASARRQSRLMTDRQLADWRVGRKLQPGDRVRFIGLSRDEVVQSGMIVPRPQGQEGVITHATNDKNGRILTFHPLEAVIPAKPDDADKQIVDLQVREHTNGWLMLERVAPPEEK